MKTQNEMDEAADDESVDLPVSTRDGFRRICAAVGAAPKEPHP